MKLSLDSEISFQKGNWFNWPFFIRFPVYTQLAAVWQSAASNRYRTTGFCLWCYACVNSCVSPPKGPNHGRSSSTLRQGAPCWFNPLSFVAICMPNAPFSSTWSLPQAVDNRTVPRTSVQVTIILFWRNERVHLRYCSLHLRNIWMS